MSNFSLVVRIKCRPSSRTISVRGSCDHAVILLLEHRGHESGDQRLDVADDDAFDVRMHHKGAGGHARPAGHDQDRFGPRVGQRSQVPQHPLQPHVAGFVGGLHLAGRVEAPLARFLQGHGDRAIEPLPQIGAEGVRPAARRGHVFPA